MILIEQTFYEDILQSVSVVKDRRALLMKHKPVGDALNRGMQALVAIATIMGGVWVWGFRGALAAISLAIGTVLIRLWIDRRPTGLPQQLRVDGFASSIPEWLSETSAETIFEMAKAA